MVQDRFTELLTKQLTDELDSSEREEFAYLLKDSEFNQQQYDFFKSYWVQDEEQYSNSDFMFQKIKSRIVTPEDVQVHEKVVTFPKRNRFLLFASTIAALLLFTLGVSFLVFQHSVKAPVKMELTRTPSRIKSKITLSDGSLVTLNSETVLRYPHVFKGDTREVYLDGEALFDVVKDPEHPFIVHTGKMSIRVLGTVFNVRSYSDDLSSETSLIRGAIEVTLADRPSDRVILKPNEKLILKSTPVKNSIAGANLKVLNLDSVNTSYTLTTLTYLKPNDTAVVETSWANNQLVFKDEDFESIAKQMERWYGIRIKFKNNDVKEYRFTGVFETESIYQALQAMQMIEPFKYKQVNETINIY